MKKIMLIAAISFALLSQTFGLGLNRATIIGWPNNVNGTAGTPAGASRVVRFAPTSTYYAMTTDQGIYRTTNLTSGTWSACNTSLPFGGLNPISGLPYFSIHDMDICGNFLYVVCNNSVSGSSPLIYKADLTVATPTFTLVSSTSPLINSLTYHVKAVKSWVYIAGETGSGTADIFGHDPTSGFPMFALTISPGGTSPAQCYSMNAGKTSTGYDLHFCCNNGLFTLPLDNAGVPVGSPAVNTSINWCMAIDYIYTGANYSRMYLIQQQFILGHPTPVQISTIAFPFTGSPSTVTPTLVSGGRIAALGTLGNLPHFGITGSGTANVLFVGTVTASSFSPSSCSASTPININAIYDDIGQLVVGGSQYVWVTVNTSCKTDGATGIDDVEADQINVYPVPATNELTISYAGSEGAQPVITLYDLQGRQQAVNVGYAQNEAKINTSSLSKGVYLLEYNNGIRTTRRVVID